VVLSKDCAVIQQRRRLARWAFAAALGPLTGPLFLRSLACNREGDWLGAAAYAGAIPAVWMILAYLAKASWAL
jgi:hypothetical protein